MKKVAKRIAVLVRERQEEAMRMAIGVTLADDIVDVYILDRKIEETEKNILNLKMMRDMKMQVFTNYKGNKGIKYLTTEEIAQRLLEYDHILPY